METLTISDGVAEAVIVPGLGAGLASYDLLGEAGPVPLFRPCRDLAHAHPFDLAHNLLLPWSGRISGGGFRFDGTFHELAPNLEGERLPIHGNGFSSAWNTEQHTTTQASLVLQSDGPGPYRYDARVTYRLDDGALRIDLAITHRGDRRLPYGLGLHPWFPRTPATSLQARATTVTLEDSRHLPAGQLPVTSREDWDFGVPRRLPGAWINNDFWPWDGGAEIAWPERGLGLTVDTCGDPRLTTYILYSPASDAPFFCFEPVMHPVDAHNRSGGPEANGLAVLAAGQSLSVQCRFRPHRLPSGAADNTTGESRTLCLASGIALPK